ncbi:MAG: hypothetical protein SFV54_20360 [Bryobacteraceae bacterium]|nr:hypothetical protein [Bryobacteraceae bacterium]
MPFLDIHPARYRLLADLFRELTERRELFTQLGNDGIALRTAALLYFILIALMSALIAFSAPPVQVYSMVFQGIAVFMLFTILLSETGNSLVNPVEASVLAHRPISGATYTAAKLTHLSRILLFFVPALSAPPAIAGLLLKDARWFFPLAHLGIAAVAGVLVALFCCALYGALLRFIPPARLKSAAQTVELFAWVGFVFLGPATRRLSHLDPRPLLYALPPLVLLSLFALRFLSVDYLARVTAIQRGAPLPKTTRRSLIGPLIARYCGGPPARAAFEYTSRLMRRDYQFRRQAIALASTLALLGPALHSIPTDPFSSVFTPIHLVPHTIGLLTILLALILPGGGHHQASWLFRLAPPAALRSFVEGVWVSVWLGVIVPPNLLLAAALLWFWPVPHALLFALFSLGVGTAYSVAALPFIEGLPFTRQPIKRQPVMFPVLVVSGVVMAFAVALQHFVLFRSLASVAAAALVLFAASLALRPKALAVFEASSRFHLDCPHASLSVAPRSSHYV